MITVNTYAVTERTVYESIARAISALASDTTAMTNPENVVSIVSEHVMAGLSSVFDFGPQPIRFTPDILSKIYVHQANEESQKSAQPEPTEVKE